jgi:hypothetical protein
VTASRLRSWIEPGNGPSHASRIAAALASAASMVDSDRCELDEVDVAQRIAEHARPLDSRGLADIAKGDLDALARRAEALRARAPFAPRLPHARTAREQTLRHYAAAFGIELPPRSDGEREKTEAQLAHLLDKLALLKPRATVVHVWAPPPGRGSALLKSIQKLRAQRVTVRWTTPLFEHGIAPLEPQAEGGAIGSVESAVVDAVLVRARASRERGERLLRQVGARPVHTGPRKGAA